MKLSRFALTLALIVATALGCAAFPIKVAGLDTLKTAIWIHDLTWGYDLVSRNIDRPLIPASVTKSVTTGSLLSLASPDERFATDIEAVGHITPDSTLRGNVVIHAVGDPTIESRHFASTRGFADSIASALLSAGIRRIEGSVIVDEEAFTDATTPPGWMDEDLLWPYGARLQGANFRDNSFTITLPSGDSSPYVPDINVSLTPARGGRKVVKGKGKRRRTVYVGGSRSSLSRADGSETFAVTMNPRGRRTEQVATPYPAKPMRHEVLATLRRRGVAVSDTVVATPGASGRVIHTHYSPRFSEILRSLMVRSDNLMAEGMLRAILPGGTRADAIGEEMNLWTLAGIPLHGVSLYDGSGLSRSDRLTARFLGEMGRHLVMSPLAAEYVRTFPRAGMDGTVRNFLAATPLRGRVVLKSGTMKGVKSYSGFLLNEEGKPTHLIVFMANDFRCSAAAVKSGLEKLLLDTFAPAKKPD